MQQSLLKRLFWLVVFWGAGVLTLAVAGSVFRLLMNAAGFKS
ncbi:hypothetical protein GTGU_00636 [Trabulsiella guamensis ATCC 49490]|uniref:DUF2474 domain-containing protein n=1 Tax=Trabulsiella guamensis ATCC 49490 TaxID=1005994 RepID=A0A085AJB1_9ENTR|nr:DUF2474 domain-containing protein [Trabulsiella guamensis]KFC10306.1 hypothetical protein GTGU_00636 [Trabulsiella guamensis ATCC 49490]